MKRVLIIFGVIVGVLLLAAVIVPFLVPTSVYKAQVEKAAADATGREVILTGNPSLSIFPSISVKIDGASVSNPEGFANPQMITAGEFKANIKLWPLFSQRVEVAEITLSDATVNLERLATGEANWVFNSVNENEPEAGDEDASSSGFNTSIGRARLRNANVFYIDRTSDSRFALTEVNIEARLSALSAPLISSGSGRLNGQAFAYEIDLDTIEDLTMERPASLIASLETDYGSVQYDGAVKLGEAPSLEGAFKLKSDTLSDLAALIEADLPIRTAALDRFSVEGTLSGPFEALIVEIGKSEFRAEGLELDYAGQIMLSDPPTLNGAITARADNPSRLFKPDADLGMLSIISDLDVKANISGAAASPRLTNVVLTQKGSLLNADFKGNLSLAGAGAVTGRLSANSKDLRGLLAALQIEAPDGEGFKAFSLNGNASGGFEGLSLADAVFKLDELTATGKVGADLSGARPRLSANVVIPDLDLTPFLGSDTERAQPDAPAASDWDDTPLALDALKLVDADLVLNVGSVKIDDVTLQDALLQSTLVNGQLKAEFRRAEGQPGFRAFDGAWSGDMTLDASRATPSMTFKANAEGVAAQKLFDTLTGFDRLGGIGEVHVDLSSSGNSLKSLVQGLNGDFGTSLNDGVLRGVNLAQLVRSFDNAGEMIRQGNLNVASLGGLISSEAETDFTSFLGDLKFSNGVATIEGLQLENPVLGVTGSGAIDLGSRTIDLRLVPRIDANAQGGGQTVGLSGIPIPLRVSGDWHNLSFGLDTSAVQQDLTARARGRVASEIADRVDGPLGSILGGVVGGGQPTSAPLSEAEPTPETGTEAAPETEAETESEAEQSLEDQVRDRVVDEALGSIFGRGKDE